ncbi:hypothetical protein [Shewanella colwelliana]|uniref:hypothetical protein n=1 Tax=Shewanella colwelliana TaxID=23 RepID=UPI00048BBB49|nr:hypothetical protein [Shewanella colwelliana]
MDNFVWNDFGTLSAVDKTDKLVTVTNSDGEARKMSVAKYKESALAVHQKAQSLIGKQVTIRTSQNTADWSTQVWFSEIVSL